MVEIETLTDEEREELENAHRYGPSSASMVLHLQLAEARETLARLGAWADTYGAALVPHGGAADTFGDGVRACKAQVKAILSAQPAASDASIAAEDEQTIPAAPVERECACGDNFDSVSGPHDCVAGSGQPAAQSEPGASTLQSCRDELRRLNPRVCTDAERRVLEACETIPDSWLRHAVSASQITRGLAPMAAAELARRESKP